MGEVGVKSEGVVNIVLNLTNVFTNKEWKGTIVKINRYKVSLSIYVCSYETLYSVMNQVKSMEDNL